MSAAWTPPPGFEKVDSALGGIVVYAPAAPDPGAEPRRFDCAGCGAQRLWSVAEGALACPHCGHVESPSVGRDPAASEEIARFTEDALRSAPRGWGEDRRELGCGQCGARVSLTEGALCASCPFCASVQVEVHAAPPSGLRPGALLPFSVQAGAAEAAVRAWLGRGWMHPGGLRDGAILERMQGIYVPCWSFSATLESEWQAEVGHTHYRTVSDGRGGTRQESYTVWRWEDGAVRQRLEDHLVFGTARIRPGLLDQLRRFDLSERAPYDASFLAGWQALAYDVPLRAAWDRGRKELRERARQACRSDASTPQLRNFEMESDLQDESWRLLLLPVYVSSYRYEGETFQVLVRGRDAAVAGHKPVIWRRVWIAIGAMWLASLFMLLIPPLGLAMLIGSLIASIWIYRSAKRAEGA